ncbi:MAG TPA: cupin domain-containing protein [Solirubrobacteraceae bacterium]|nr:cupin domain-containing protein [Solirubrobacteraceae bacterium]
MPSTPFHAAFADLPRESLAGGVLERTAVRTDDALVTFNWIQPGHPEVPPHEHPYDQLSFVFSGTLELELDGAPYRVRAGELLYIPAGVPHTGRVVGEEIVLNVDVFAPVRDDYLALASHQPD